MDTSSDFRMMNAASDTVEFVAAEGLYYYLLPLKHLFMPPED
jgi:hypothetical protein